MSLRQAFREKIVSVSSSLSGIVGFLGSYQVCHNICLGVIFLLSLIGIAVVGMPLLFLTKVAIPFWIIAAILFAVSLTFYLSQKCISKNMLLLNGGILIAGMPFLWVQDYQPYLWIVGGVLVLCGVGLWIQKKLSRE